MIVKKKHRVYHFRMIRFQKKILSVFITLLIFCAGLCGAASSQIENFILIDGADSSDPASKKLWHYILSEIKLSEKLANLHNIYESDCKAIFYDLDDDGEDEILGTHYATGSRNLGYNILYILKKQKNGNYDDLGYRIFFASNSPVFILKNKTKGFHDLRCYNGKTELDSVFVYSKSIDKYVDKKNQKILEKEFKEQYY